MLNILHVFNSLSFVLSKWIWFLVYVIRFSYGSVFIGDLDALKMTLLVASMKKCMFVAFSIPRFVYLNQVMKYIIQKRTHTNLKLFGLSRTVSYLCPRLEFLRISEETSKMSLSLSFFQYCYSEWWVASVDSWLSRTAILSLTAAFHLDEF